jgi:hypothetical protein
MICLISVSERPTLSPGFGRVCAMAPQILSEDAQCISRDPRPGTYGATNLASSRAGRDPDLHLADPHFPAHSYAADQGRHSGLLAGGVA